ncbi:MAG: hypothetical protein Q7V01_03050 [Vicinamibacterales bacterium]|nr:hypothetical protein [Vicinamibacterales bacterium]
MFDESTMMIAPRAAPPAGTQTAFEFEDLEPFACGCVAARFRVLPWSGHLVRVEAKGTYCPFESHKAGAIVGLGIRSDALSSDDSSDTLPEG